MQEQSLMVVNGASPANIKECRGNYELTLHDGRNFRLKRDVDFGKIPGTKKPTLYKAGAETIRWEYGVVDKYELMSCIEDMENGFFMYRFKCSLVKYHEGAEIVVAEGYGSANTRERNVGSASGFEVANTKLKIAEKRAMTDAVIKLARLSSIFTQDIDNEDFMAQSDAISKSKPEDDITAKQRQRIFAIAAQRGYSSGQAKNLLKSKGFASTKDIKQKDYDALCEEFANLSEPEKAGV